MSGQDFVAAAIAATALGWLILRRVRRKARLTPMCGDCPGCSPSTAATAAAPHHAATNAPAFIPVSELRVPKP